MTIRVVFADEPGEARDIAATALRHSPEMIVELTDSIADLEAFVRQGDVNVAVVAIDTLPGATAAIERLVQQHGLPIVALADSGDVAAAGALAAGALGVAARPRGGEREERRFVDMVRSLSTVQMLTRHSPRAPQPAVAGPIEVVALVASTGGPPALVAVLRALPERPAAPILIVQHIADGFGAGLATWLTSTVPQEVCVATAGHQPVPGEVLLAPDGTHLTLRDGRVALRTDPLVHGHRPSASVLLHSLTTRGSSAAAVVLTGMGRDGSDGAAAMRAVGAHIICQNAETAVINSMPAAAVAAGAASEVLGLPEIGPRVAHLLQRGRSPSTW